MHHPSYTLLYVDNPMTSVQLYTQLFDIEPVETSSTFALFVLESGLKFGLWSKHTAEPTPTCSGGGCEIGFSVESKTEVEDFQKKWADMGLTIAQEPTQMDFGYTFVALDPDGHRLRVFKLDRP